MKSLARRALSGLGRRSSLFSLCWREVGKVPRPRLALAALTLSLATAIGLGAPALASRYLLLRNMSDSLPGTWFLVVRGSEPRCGELFSFSLPSHRPYLGGVRMLKIALGCAGSLIEAADGAIWIDGARVGQLRRETAGGHVLEPVKETLLEPGQFFGWAPHSSSLDSRYREIGVIEADWIDGRAFRLW